MGACATNSDYLTVEGCVWVWPIIKCTSLTFLLLWQNRYSLFRLLVSDMFSSWTTNTIALAWAEVQCHGGRMWWEKVAPDKVIRRREGGEEREIISFHQGHNTNPKGMLSGSYFFQPHLLAYSFHADNSCSELIQCLTLSLYSHFTDKHSCIISYMSFSGKRHI